MSTPLDGAAPSGAPASPPAVRLIDVHHRYADTRAADALTLDLPAGRMVGFIGPDGVGKSTWLGLVAGARTIQRGTVEVLGGDMADARHRARVCPRIAYMPQGLGKNLYPTLSVFENIDFFGRLFGQSAAERRRRIDALLAATGMAAFAERPASKLSGGMKQKLGLCCALIHDPDLLILDEPTTGVDPLSRRQFWELIDRIRAERPGMSVLIATAYMEEAEGYDWLVAVDAGRVLATGTPAELRAAGGADTLEEAFIALLPEARRRNHRRLEIPPIETGEVVIEARGLQMRFGDFVAVDDVNLQVRRGEIFGFLGSNGCGKSTTMKMLTGLLEPSAGEALLLGRRLDASNIETRRRVGYMSQSFSLYGELSVRQNLDLHARLFQLPADAAASRIAELARRFDLAPVMDVQPDALPLGIRQRLQLAVAVLHRPDVLILDEPTSGVDPVARDHFWALIVDLSRKDGVTIFITTHFMNEAQRCDRISLMHAGRILASDTPAALTAARGCARLEDAFIAYLEEASGVAPAPERPPDAEIRALRRSYDPPDVSAPPCRSGASRETRRRPGDHAHPGRRNSRLAALLRPARRLRTPCRSGASREPDGASATTPTPYAEIRALRRSYDPPDTSEPPAGAAQAANPAAPRRPRPPRTPKFAPCGAPTTRRTSPHPPVGAAQAANPAAPRRPRPPRTPKFAPCGAPTTRQTSPHPPVGAAQAANPAAPRRPRPPRTPKFAPCGAPTTRRTSPHPPVGAAQAANPAAPRRPRPPPTPKFAPCGAPTTRQTSPHPPVGAAQAAKPAAPRRPRRLEPPSASRASASPACSASPRVRRPSCAATRCASRWRCSAAWC
ncbi:hypothetical protein MASR2M50_05130 [Thauera sp.]